ncbi:hypothetical protein Halru_0622 [Halovivax ruber XH-70]|uniref:Right handed beta helix domain-containing protein n=1 Tax=Halovivax ruber (strain DSM 18193 / JCM 13892 / XH-70) TaxID=797302 RepID=L0I964_HALRX|nr:hypothetical protein [Halovivax ruber]AGB15249.1 hypothetical protein Halru_0622 [Halovivax ruber XH-70]
MSADDTNADESIETSRRQYLFGAGAALGALGLLGTAGRSAAAEDYETITVGAGETFTKNVGSGEIWENKLIDISASGATYQIQADGSDWTIRNIGIIGHYEGGHTEPFRARVTDPNGTGIIENVYVAPTVGDGNATGLYVYWNHAGHIEIERFNVQNWTDNGIYASGPGNSGSHSVPGAGGTVTIRNSYSKNNDTSNFRLGTHGSKLVNCCAAGGSSRGHWQFYESAEIVDCDLGGHTSDLALGDAVWEKSNHASLTMSNSRWETAHAHGGASTANIDGTPQGSPVDRVPDGCPTSAEEAASGSGSVQEPAPKPPTDKNLVAFVTKPDARFAAYEFRANGAVEFTEAPYESPSGGQIEGGTYKAEDFVEQIDGAWHAGGVTGGGAGDAFLVDGPVTSVSVDQPDAMWIELDGERVSADELVERTGGSDEDGTVTDEFRTLEIAGQCEYRVEVSGEIRPAEAHAKWLTEGEAYGDDWAEWWLSGSDSARTVWEFTGEIMSLEIDDRDGDTELRTLAVDGEELDHSEYVDIGPHRLEVAGQYEYRIEVSGEIRPAEAHAKWLTEGEAYGDDWAEWWLSGSDEARTVWIYTGEITNLDVTDYGGVTDVRTLTVDGKSVEPSQL